MLSIQEALNSIESPHAKPWKSKKIRLIGSKLSSEELTLISQALKKFDSVRSLEICLCEIQEDAILNFATDMDKYSLILLQLVHVGIGDRGALAIAQALEKSRVRKLDMSYNNIQAEGAKEIADALPRSSLEMLLVGRNRIGVEGAKAIARSLGEDTQLKSLDVRMNGIQDEGALALVRTLTHSKLVCLQLDANNITHVTIDELCDLLPESQLEMLFAGSNSLGDASLIKLASKLNESKLKKLVVNQNSFTNVGVRRLAQAIGSNTRLEYLDLRQNVLVDDASLEILLENVKTHVSLRKVLVSETSCSERLKAELEQRVEALHTERAKLLTTLASAKVLDRLSTKSSLRLLPTELIRSVGDFL